MRTKILQLLILLSISIGCTSNKSVIEEMTPPSNSKNKILCLGDSRVDGFRPHYESYRYDLWKNLVNTTKEFDFIGSFKDDASYPLYNNLTFDNDHSGIGGDTTIGVINRLDIALSDTPDFVLLGIGGNDITEGKSIPYIINNLKIILDGIKDKNANTVVFLEIIAGANPNSDLGQSLNSLIIEYEQQLKILATEKSSENFKVVLVDMNTNFTTNANFYADDVHYNALGAKEIADRYFNAMNSYLK